MLCLCVTETHARSAEFLVAVHPKWMETGKDFVHGEAREIQVHADDGWAINLDALNIATGKTLSVLVRISSPQILRFKGREGKHSAVDEITSRRLEVVNTPSDLVYRSILERFELHADINVREDVVAREPR